MILSCGASLSRFCWWLAGLSRAHRFVYGRDSVWEVCGVIQSTALINLLMKSFEPILNKLKTFFFFF